MLGKDCGTALQVAAENGRYDPVQLLLAYGAGISLQYGSRKEKASGKKDLEWSWWKPKRNALQGAATNGQHKIVQVLIDEEANVNIRK